MAIKRVLIIYDPERYTKQMILEDLREENFSYSFKFFNDVAEEVIGGYVVDADEVWTFGDVDPLPVFKFAKQEGKDIWEMA